MKKNLLLILTLLITSVSFAQTNITGRVTSTEDGEALSFVTVAVKGTTIAVATDLDGKYSINVPSGGTVLSFSFVGMKTVEATIGGRTVVDVKMEYEAMVLDEAIVVAYGVVARGGSPFGAKSTVTKEKLEIPTTSIDKALQGNAAGVSSISNSGQPGAGQQVTIRGIGSISGGSTPLYILDGMPIATGNYGSMTQTTGTSNSGDNFSVLSNLNPNDIESVTILKDAAAISIYGSRASNGVIIITTKSGKAGKTQFNLKLTSGFSSRTTQNFTLMNKDQYLDYATDMFLNTTGYSTATTDVNGRQVLSQIANTFRIRNADKDFYEFDWTKHAYNDNAPMYTVDFSASGGNDNTKFYVSLSALDQTGIVIDTWLKRYTARFNLEHKINNKVRFGLNTLLSYNDQRSALTTGGYYASPVFGAAMYAPIDVGIISPGSYLYTGSTGNFANVAAGPNIDYLVTYANANFLANSAYDDFYTRTSRNVTNGYVQWSIREDLILKGSAGIDYFYVQELDWRDPRPKGNSASQNRGLNNTAMQEQFTWNETITLNYIKSFNNHNVNALLGQEAMSEGTNNLNASAQDFPTIPGVIYPSSGANNYSISGGRNASALASFFGSANYNYDRKYFLSASLRTDGSSRLSTENKWNMFWSVGGSWRISNESFMQSVSLINSLNLRGSYGTAGSTAGIGRYASMGLYGIGAYNGTPTIQPSQIPNHSLTWQTVAALDIGLDISILNNRISATIDWYRRDTKDMLLGQQLSRTSGFSTITSNLGELYNTGIEFELHTTPISTDNFVWNIDFNITSNRNRITKLNNNQDIIDSPYIYRVGEDMHSFYTYPWAGVNPADGRPMYYDKAGEIIYQYNQGGDHRNIVGTATPDFYGGLTTTFAYKGIDLSAMFYYTYGGLIYDSSWLMFTGTGNRAWYNQHESVAYDRWRKEGDMANYPKAVYNYASATYGTTTSKSVFDGSYIRLRNLTLGYNLPKKWTDSVKINGVRIYAQGTNLFTMTSYPNADPEVGGGSRAGYYYLGYPNARTITFGLDIKF